MLREFAERACGAATAGKDFVRAGAEALGFIAREVGMALRVCFEEVPDTPDYLRDKNAQLCREIAEALPDVQTLEELVALMKELDQFIPQFDGLKSIHKLFTATSQEVLDTRNNHDPWKSPDWTCALQRELGKLYLSHVQEYLSQSDDAPSVWQTILDRRGNQKISEVQFDFAALHAQIAHDLPLAIVRACEENGRRGLPHFDSPEEEDFGRMRELLGVAVAEMKLRATGPIAFAGRMVEPYDTKLAARSLDGARHAAWFHAYSVWNKQQSPEAQKAFMKNIDAVAANIARILLIPTEPYRPGGAPPSLAML